jgi:hypothetical protein
MHRLEANNVLCLKALCFSWSVARIPTGELKPEIYQARGQLSARKKSRKIFLAAPLDGSKRNTRATKAREIIPRNGPFVHAGERHKKCASQSLNY